MPLTRPTKTSIVCIGFVLIHTMLHLSAFWFEVLPGLAVSIWYAPSGLALALLVLLGPRYAGLVFLTHFATSWITHTPREPWTAFFFPGLLTATYTLTAWWVRRHVGPRMLPGSARETLVFCLAIVGGPVIAAVIGTTVVTLTSSMNHPQSIESFLLSVRDWWIGDASGILTVVPAVMVFVGPWLDGESSPIPSRPLSSGRIVMMLIRGAVLLGTLVAVLLIPVLREHRAFYLCFLPLVWICVYHGLKGATLATLMVMIIGLVGMRQEGTTVAYSYIFLLFEIAVAGVGLGLGTMVQRRDEAEARLAASNAELAKLRRLEFNEKVMAQVSEEKARLQLLRYQLNPHFLYNSLNSIYGLLFQDAKGASEMVLRLSDFCRATLTADPENMPTIGDEIDAMKSYLSVEQVRWQDKLEIDFDIPDAVGEIKVPPFLLLPLVENAIKYGGQTSQAALKLKIWAKQNGDAVSLVVENTGSWVRPGESRAISTGVGLENLRQRLERYYPDRHEFTTSSADGWVSARIYIKGAPREIESDSVETEPSSTPLEELKIDQA